MIPNRVELTKWISEIFEEPLENIRHDSTRDTIPGWDSLGVLVLMANLDEKFGIVLTADEIAKLQSVDDIFRLIENNAQQ